MKTVICLGGEPATGKTTLIKGLMLKLDQAAGGKNSFMKFADLITGHFWNDTYPVFLLGEYSDEKTFSGTDTLSMAVQPRVIPWMKSLPDDCAIIIEGDRLVNMSFMEAVAKDPDFDLKCMILKADKAVKDQRHIDRADTQDDKFLKGRATKYMNILSNMDLMDKIVVNDNNTPEDGIKNMMQLFNWIENAVDSIPF